MLTRIQKGDLGRECARVRLGIATYSDKLLERLVLQCTAVLGDTLRQ